MGVSVSVSAAIRKKNRLLRGSSDILIATGVDPVCNLLGNLLTENATPIGGPKASWDEGGRGGVPKVRCPIVFPKLVMMALQGAVNGSPS